jgi:fatty acid synthase
MAAVGLSWAEAANRCPDGVVPACNNSADMVTISGPAAGVAKFVGDLKAEGVFAKEVDSSGVAFHSYIMKKCSNFLRKALQKV